MGKSNIEWTDETDNIIVAAGTDGTLAGWWCRKCSEGCDHCYAEEVNDNSFFKGNHLPYTGAAPKLILRTEIIDGWARQTRPRKHFVASMTDVFGEWVQQEWIHRFLDGMAAAPRQTFQVLTKRSRRMRETVVAWLELRGLHSVPENIWLGVSVENQKWADIRIPDLLAIPAAVRFLSCEPLLGKINLLKSIKPSEDDYEEVDIRDESSEPEEYEEECEVHFDWVNYGNRLVRNPEHDEWLRDRELCARSWALSRGIHWIIVGGESGDHARPMHPDWARTLRDQCQAAGVPFFFKQWGEWGRAPNFVSRREDVFVYINVKGESFKAQDASQKASAAMIRVGKKTAGRVLDDRTWDEFPKLAHRAVAPSQRL